MDELLKNINEGLEALKDFSKIKHLFSDDDATRKIAKLREAMGQARLKIELSKIKKTVHPKNKALIPSGYENCFVSVRPCDKDLGGKTFLGLYIGDVALSSSITITDEAIQCNWSHHNPAIFIPDLNRVVYGIESWWGQIESEDDLKQITDIDIDNVWYVKALEQINQSLED